MSLNLNINISKLDKYILLPIIIGIGQFSGYGVLAALLIVSAIFISLSKKLRITNLNQYKYFLLFSILAILFGIINLFWAGPSSYSFQVWIQFFIAGFIPLLVSDRKQLLKYFIIVVLLIFLLDFVTNLLLVLSIDISWAEIPYTRINEKFPRLGGIMNNGLYSSAISYLIFCFVIDKRSRDVLGKYRNIIFLIVVLNLLFAGSRRTLVLLFPVILIKIFPLLRKDLRLLVLLFLGAIAGIISLNYLTINGNPSNSLRWDLWIYSIGQILDKPITGHGIYFPDLTDVVTSFDYLSSIVVTESFILAIGYSFGIITMLSFIIFIMSVLAGASRLKNYSFQFGIFFGLSIELFIGGTLENTLSAFIYFLCGFLLLEKEQALEDGNNNVINKL